MNAAKARQNIAFFILGFATLVVVIPIILTILYVIIKGIGAVNWGFLTEPP